MENGVDLYVNFSSHLFIHVCGLYHATGHTGHFCLATSTPWARSASTATGGTHGTECSRESTG